MDEANVKRRTSQRIDANRTFPQLALLQRGVDDLAVLPVRTEQSVSKCLSMRMLGSSPGGIAMGF